MFARAVLLIPGALFIVYGAMCWYNPELPAEYAGLWVAHQDGMAELAAMYGGLQLCLGSIIFLSGILKGYSAPGAMAIDDVPRWAGRSTRQRGVR